MNHDDKFRINIVPLLKQYPLERVIMVVWLPGSSNLRGITCFRLTYWTPWGTILPYLRIYKRYIKNSKCYPHIFEDGRFNGAFAELVSCTAYTENDEEIQHLVK